MVIIGKRNVIVSLFLLVFLYATAAFSQDVVQDPYQAYPAQQAEAYGEVYPAPAMDQGYAPDQQAYDEEVYPAPAIDQGYANGQQTYDEEVYPAPAIDQGYAHAQQTYDDSEASYGGQIALSDTRVEEVRYRPHDGLRVFAETSIGLLVSGSFATATAFAGVSLIYSAFTFQESSMLASMLGLITLPIIGPAAIGGSVHLTGYFMENQGYDWAPYLGSYVGMAAGFALFGTVAKFTDSDAGFWASYVIGWSLPAIGAVLGYELSDMRNTKRSGIRWTPYANVSPDLKSAYFGVSLAF
ncbi:MAG: hypothetical protein ACOX8U_03795 [Bradymonadia bacterium]|jgi:hypothetical protein